MVNFSVVTAKFTVFFSVWRVFGTYFPITAALLGGVLHLFAAGGEGEFVGVEEVLPDDVGGGTNEGQRGEVHLGHPDGQGGVLLAEGLTSRDAGDTGLVGGDGGGIDDDVLVVLAVRGSRETEPNPMT